jgi:hypothetical protein
MRRKLMLFNWRRQWKRRVAPYLCHKLVELSLYIGMMQLDENWKEGDPPWLLGRTEGRRVVPGKLSWYRPIGCCHWIAYFSMAIGVLNYPFLEWRFISGDHTIPVGYDADGNPRVVMDILLFDKETAEESIAFAMKQPDKLPEADEEEPLNKALRVFYTCSVVPRLRAEALQEREEAVA